MDGGAVFNQVLILFLIMAVGYFAKKRNIITKEVCSKLSELLLYITLPFLIITSFDMDFSKDMLYNAAVVFICAVGAHIVAIVVGMFIYRKYPGDVKKVMKFATIYTNSGFMGFPILYSVFGKIGVFYGSIYGVAFNLFIWTNGVMIFSGEKDLKSFKRALLNPGVLAVFIGFVMFAFSIKLPSPIFSTLDTIGSMTTPLSMLIIGGVIADTRLKTLFTDLAVYYVTFIKLLALPVVVMVMLKLAGIDSVLLKAVVLIVSMPAAANTVIFSEKFGGDSILASKVVAVSTLLSVITIPFVMLML